jgi:hypothetical protein
MTTYDVVVVGSGAAGLIAAIQSSQNGNTTLLLEKLPQLASKLKATGGGRCNLSNTLDNESFMKSFGKNGRFMRDALEELDHKKLMEFFKSIGVDTHIPDGFRIFPVTHNSSTIIEALKNKLLELQVKIETNQKLQEILIEESKIKAIKTQDQTYNTYKIILATGGLGYPTLGATGDGYEVVKKLGHSITSIYPAMMPLHTLENWQANCTADTIAKATIKVDSKENKIKKLKATGDLIFTKKGLRGPVILDFAREITPHLDSFKEVPILINLTKGMNEDDILQHIKKETILNPQSSIEEQLIKILPISVVQELCKLCTINSKQTFKNTNGVAKNKLIKLLAWTPFTINGHDGFEKAMITRGGISLKEINPKTMQSKIISGLYFAGEIVDLDGPCGGYNLQWAFSSGFLAGKLLS